MDLRRIYIAIGAGVFVLLCAAVFIQRFNSQSAAERSAVLVAGYTECTGSSKPKAEIGVCLRQLAKKAMVSDSVEDVDAALGAITAEKDLEWCHEFMHYAGWELYDKKGSFADAFTEASGKCDSGMMHGVVEEYVSKSAPGNDVAHFAKTVSPTTCDEPFAASGSSPDAKATCNHGLGHAFMFLTDNALHTSLGYCDFLAPQYRSACYGGVYMEELQEKQVGRTNTGHKSLFGINPADPDYPCDTLDTTHKSVCYRFIGTASFLKSPNDTRSAFTRCLAVDRAYRTDCFWGIGNNIPSPSTETKAAALSCDGALKVSDEAYRQCVMGGVTFVVQMGRGKTEQAEIYCNAVQVPYKDTCYKTAIQNLKGWTTSTEEFARLCGTFASTDVRTLCLAN